ncbi:MAG: PAC2 family protein [Candidatus Micrarchaeota archaeon]|nr:PAC2 family protein [Candidatus Micrarchaeota archaeon]
MAEPSFSASFVRVRSKPKLKKPILVAGLPGIGFVSKMAVDHLVRLLKAEHFATLYSPHFPNQVLALRSGRLRPFTMKLYYKKLKGRDMVFLRGDLQPLTVEGQYEVSSAILSFFKSLGGSMVLAMAGYAVPRKQKQPVIYAFSTSKILLETLRKNGAHATDVIVPVVGMAGLLPALARVFGLSGACLLVETAGENVDAEGAKSLVGFLGKLVGQKFDTKALDVRASKSKGLLKRIEQQARREEGQSLPAMPGARDQVYIQ